MEQKSVDNLNFQEDISHKSDEEKIDKPTTLIMKGGGIKGLAYVGVLEVLTSNGYNFDWFAGTSAGAISAALMGVGYSYKELETELYEKNFNEFKDAKLLGCIWNLITKGGLYKAKTFTDWLDNLLAIKLYTPNRVLFNTLEKKNISNRITIYASRRGTDVDVFDSKLLRTLPDSKSPPIAFAVRSSMAIPFFFTPTSIFGYDTVDGGIQNNYPVNALLRANPGTKFVGLYLGPEIFEREARKSLLGNLFSILTESSDGDALRVYEDDTIVIDPRPISTFDFSLTIKEKDFLLEGGRLSALRFLDKKNVIALPINYSDRKEKHEIIRKELIKGRKIKSIKKVIKVLVILAIIILTTIYFESIKCWVYNFSSSYRTSVVKDIDLNATFLTKKNSTIKLAAWDLVNNPSSSESPCNFIPTSFYDDNFPNTPSLIRYICLTKNEIKIVFHFSSGDTKYFGFKFKINNLKIGDVADGQKIWYPYNCVDIFSPIYNEFLLRRPNLEGDYVFKAKIIAK